MITLLEDPGDLLTRLVFTPLTHLAVRRRYAESLRRLKRLAEQRAYPRRGGAASAVQAGGGSGSSSTTSPARVSLRRPL